VRHRSATGEPAHYLKFTQEGEVSVTVDDNATNRMMLRNMLTHWGMRPTVAEGGNVALQLLRDAHRANEPFGLILLDVMMPVMDGFEVLERIRQMPEISRPVIMMLSSRDEPGDAARARELGAAGYIVKPCELRAVWRFWPQTSSCY
jgi:CheY-like chemotaxis protein